VFGEVSDFLAGLGHHLTDMTPIEILTLAPLGALIVVFGIVPGLVLDLVKGSVDATLGSAAAGAPIPVGADVTLIVVGLLVLGVVARTGWAIVNGRSRSTDVVAVEGGAAH
jgi:hypothetical protein